MRSSELVLKRIKWVSVLLVVQFIILMALGLGYAVVEDQNSTQANISCRNISVLAGIASKTLDNQIKTNALILPKISFPGLTHEELIKLSGEKLVEEGRNVADLKRVAKDSCG